MKANPVFSGFRTACALCIALCVSFFLISCPPPSKEDFEIVGLETYYYVASWGKDDNAGLAPGLPFKTLRHAVFMAAADAEHNTVIVLDNLTIASEDSSTPDAVFLIDGTGGKEVTVTGRGNITFDGLGGASPLMRVKGGARLIIENITLKHTLAAGLIVEGASRVTLRNITIRQNKTGLFVDSAAECLFESGKIQNNDNSAAGPGGALVRGGGLLTLRGNAAIQRNSGSVGGVRVEGSSVLALEGSSIISLNSNQTYPGTDGGGVYLTGSGSKLTMTGTSSIAGNLTLGEGAGVYAENSALLVMDGNCLITGNSGEEKTAPYSSGPGGGVVLRTSAVLEMRGNSKITANTADQIPYAAGVDLGSSCELRMKGGSRIEGNQVSYYSSIGSASDHGGGVRGDACSITLEGNSRISYTWHTVGLVLHNGGSLRMRENAVISYNDHGGVILFDSDITLRGNAAILRNPGQSSGGNYRGLTLFASGECIMEENSRISENPEGNVALDGSSVTMTLRGQAKVSGNPTLGLAYFAPTDGGGVVLQNGAELYLTENAAIVDIYLISLSDNPSPPHKGGGVYVGSGSAFYMQGGRVSGNKVIGNDSGTDFYGGGVYVEAGGTFSMTGGIISGNSVNKAGVSSGPYKGGGVAVESGGSYSQSGGTIYGQNETAAELRNSAQDGGHALWNAGADSNNTL